jgi:predicted acetyltransferase
MNIDVRTATADDWGLVKTLDERTFGFTATGERELERRVCELDRTVFGTADGVEVALGSIYSLSMSVPGGTLVPTAGVTWVGVQATHRRRGILTAMMRRLVDDTRDRGKEPLLALWASDPGIYGRYGYGMATRALGLSIPTQRGRLSWAADPEPGLTVRMADAADARDAQVTVARRVAEHRAGGLVRTDPFWDLHLEDGPADRGGASAARAFVVDDADGPRAYARFRTKIAFDKPVAAGELGIREVGYIDPQAAALLWRTLLGHDLIGTVTTRNLPLDDPLLWLLEDPRSAQPMVKDGLHVRIIDVPHALETRSYATPIDVVLDLDDPFAPWCTGRYHLSGGPDGATCTTTQDAADVALGAAELGAVYLGGTPLSVLADAGRVRELTPGAVASASRALLADRAPWCPFVF